MKKLLFICLLAVAAMGCRSVSYYEPKFTIGMSETDFMKENREAELVTAANDGTKVYRTINGGWRHIPEPYALITTN